jgi:hypothetical protein
MRISEIAIEIQNKFHIVQMDYCGNFDYVIDCG